MKPLFQISYDAAEQGVNLRMSKADIQKLYEVSTEEVQTMARITFTPPMNVIDQPSVFIAKTANELKPDQFKQCTGFQGQYTNEDNYLQELCGYLQKFWLDKYNEIVYFEYDIYKLARSMKARLFCYSITVDEQTEDKTNTPVSFVFCTNDYKLMKILGYKDLETQNQIFTSELLEIKVPNIEGKYQHYNAQQIMFDRIMYIRNFRYLNILCDNIKTYTHRENNQIRYILLRHYYDIANGVYAQLSSNYYVTFTSNMLAGDGIKIYFTDENYHQINLEGEPYTLELFIEPSQKMIEKKAYIAESKQQALDQKMKAQQQEFEKQTLKKEAAEKVQKEAQEKHAKEVERVQKEKYEADRDSYFLESMESITKTVLESQSQVLSGIAAQNLIQQQDVIKLIAEQREQILILNKENKLLSEEISAKATAVISQVMSKNAEVDAYLVATTERNNQMMNQLIEKNHQLDQNLLAQTDKTNHAMADLLAKNDKLDKYNLDLQSNTNKLFDTILEKSNENDKRIVEQIQKMNDAKDIQNTLDSITRSYDDKRKSIDHLKLDYVKKLHRINYLTKKYNNLDDAQKQQFDTEMQAQKQNVISDFNILEEAEKAKTATQQQYLAIMSNKELDHNSKKQTTEEYNQMIAEIDKSCMEKIDAIDVQYKQLTNQHTNIADTVLPYMLQEYDSRSSSYNQASISEPIDEDNVQPLQQKEYLPLI
ncbi:Hypothetical_protein [Hexamita inflata]|uniref:Hypothetical_protein n=1 Tax=Hexamita inflata TaxID=28002 RepID=A0AA86UVV2_9EUKA|nr:Hypothetical protein HINF_LOCUS54497 [Hexamita inflata]